MLTAGEINIVIRARDQASRALGRIGGAAGKMGKAVRAGAMIGVAGLAALGVAAFKFAGDFDDATNTIRRGTGATGDALEALKHDFRETFRGVPDSMADVATATADINTRLGLTGPPLQAMTRQFLDLARVAEVDVATAIAAGTRVFGDWNIATEDQTEALDHAWRVAQTTGIEVDALMQKVVNFGAPLRQFGFGFEEATVLLGKWEKEGVNTEAILGALKIGVANFARENIDAATGLQDFIDELNILGPGAEATARAIEVFGSRAGPDMAAAVTEGRFAIEDLMGIIGESDETIAAAAQATLTWKDKLRILRNDVLVGLEPLLSRITGALEEATLFIRGFVAAIRDPDITSEGIFGFGERMGSVAREIVDAFVALRPQMEAFAEHFASGFRTIMEAVTPLFQFIMDNKPIMIAALVAIGVAIVLAFGPVSVAIVAILGLITAIGWVRDNWEMLESETRRILGSISDFMNEHLSFLVDILEVAWALMENRVRTAINLIRDTVNIAMAIFRGDWQEAWEGIKLFVVHLWEGAIEELRILVFDLGGVIIRGLWAGIESMKGWLLDQVRDLGGAIFGALKSGLGKLNPFSPSEYGVEVGVGLGEGIVQGIGQILPDVEGAAGGMADAINSRLQAALAPFLEMEQQEALAGQLLERGVSPADVFKLLTGDFAAPVEELGTAHEALTESLRDQLGVVGDSISAVTRLAGVSRDDLLAVLEDLGIITVPTLADAVQQLAADLGLSAFEAIDLAASLDEMQNSAAEAADAVETVNDGLGNMAGIFRQPFWQNMRPAEMQQLLDLLNPNIPFLPRGEAPGLPVGNSSGVTQHITVIVEDRSPAAIAHAVEMAGLELGEQLIAEGA